MLVKGRTLSIYTLLVLGFVGVVVPLSLLCAATMATLDGMSVHTHELYQHRLVATVSLSQLSTNLDQMREIVGQSTLSPNGDVSPAVRRNGFLVQITTLDHAIRQMLIQYRAQDTRPEDRAILAQWPAAWRAFTQERARILQASTRGSLSQALHIYTTTFGDRLDTLIDLTGALTGAEQRASYDLDQASQDSYQRTLLLFECGGALTVLISAALSVVLVRAVARLYAEARLRADCDPVTGLLNHRGLLERIERLIAGHTPGALILCDVDNFKLFNDTYGHPAGDTVLQGIAAALQHACRGRDVAARYGGDEFAVLLHDVGRNEALAVMQRIARTVQSRPYATAAGALIPLGLSMGLACYPTDGCTRQELVVLADEALYAGKRHARTPLGEQQDLRPRTAADLLGDSPFGVLEGLVSAVDAKDQYTRVHSEDVTRLALLLAGVLGCSEEERRVLAVAGPLHDIGKIAVPDRILRKPGRLTDEEYAAIKNHVGYGVAILRGVLGDAVVVDVVAAHHERWDGCGYPRGLPGVETPLLGRIMQVADAVSAMTLDRPYRRGLPWDEVVAALRAGAGSQFDPALVEPFIAAAQGLYEQADARALLIPG